MWCEENKGTYWLRSSTSENYSWMINANGTFEDDGENRQCLGVLPALVINLK